MTVNELAAKMNFTVFNCDDGERTVEGGYTGDLLSWVMGRALPDCAWITIMQNQNVAAVAVLADVACVILAEGTQPDSELLAKAKTQGVNLFGSELPAFELCWKIHEAG